MAFSLRSCWGLRLIRKRPLLSVGIRPVDPDVGRQARDGGIREDHAAKSLLALRHGGEGNGLGCLGHALDRPGVLHRKKSLRNDDVEHNREQQRADGDTERESLMFEHPPQQRAITGNHILDEPGRSRDRIVPAFLGRVVQQLRAHHRREGERHHAEMRIETASVMANSRNRRPTTSPMNSRGISTAIRDTVSEMIVEADLLGALQRGGERALRLLRYTGDVLDHSRSRRRRRSRWRSSAP